jgi:hypothetical protein
VLSFRGLAQLCIIIRQVKAEEKPVEPEKTAEAEKTASDAKEAETEAKPAEATESSS